MQAPRFGDPCEKGPHQRVVAVGVVVESERSTRLRTMPRLPRKNDPDSVRARQEALGLPELDLQPWARRRSR